MQGVGSVYGFSNITSLGEEIANSARRADSARLAALIGNYHEYLAKVQVVYERPRRRAQLLRRTLGAAHLRITRDSSICPAATRINQQVLGLEK